MNIINNSISELRNNISKVFQEVTNENRKVCITKRKQIQGIIFPPSFKNLLNDKVDYSKWLALMFVEKFLPDAPPHLKNPQIKEFEELGVKKMIYLLDIDKLPVSQNVRAKLISKLGDDKLKRLEKRYKIAQAINEAESEGLYEEAEHKTSEIN